MPSIHPERTSSGQRWILRWNSQRGCRAKKVFRTRADAEAYLPYIDERPRKKSGPQVQSSIEARVLASVKIDETTGCWTWQRRCQPVEGYGLIAIDSRPRLAHRVSYETFVGPIPAGLHIDHLCRNRPCVNPDHLEPVTCRENVLRSPIAQAALNAAKTHCPQGHEYAPENTYVYAPRRMRQCRTCMREAARRSYLKRKAAA